MRFPLPSPAETSYMDEMELPVERRPAVARWELRSVATMLIATHGPGAESTAQANLARAVAENHEGDQIVWEGVLSQLQSLRAAERRR